MKKWGTKAMFADLEKLGTGVVVFIVVLALAVVLLNGVSTSTSTMYSNNTNVTPSINTGINAAQQFAGWTPLIITIAVIAVILGLVYMYFRR